MKTTKIFSILILIAVLLTACGPVTPDSTTWFGMQVSATKWKTEELDNTHFRHALLTSRALTGCRVTIMSMDPVNAGGYSADWQNSFQEQLMTNNLQLILWKVKDKDGNVFTTFFDVYDITGQSGYDLYRLGYFVVEPGDKPVECLDAVYALLMTLQPSLFPKIGTAQG